MNHMHMIDMVMPSTISATGSINLLLHFFPSESLGGLSRRLPNLPTRSIQRWPLVCSFEKANKCALLVRSTFVTEIHYKQADLDETRVRPISNTNVVGSSSLRSISSSKFTTRLSVKAVVTVVKKIRPIIHTPSDDMRDVMDIIADQLGLANILLQLVSLAVDPKTGAGKRSEVAKLEGWSAKANVNADKVQYTASFTLRQDFGTPGAVIVHNNHQNEFYLDSISLMFAGSSKDVYFPCQSWVQPVKHNMYPADRIFFSNQVYLPSETPEGLRDLRERELKALRGDGTGVRDHWERIYDYATYNDLGDADAGDKNLARPVLGGNSSLPYPRRCRTGRLPSKSDPALESRAVIGGKIYVPRDETFDPIKESTFINSSMHGLVHKLAPALLKTLKEANVVRRVQFNSFEDIDRLYRSVGAVTSSLPNLRPSESGADAGAAQDGLSVAGLGFLKGPIDFFRKLPFLGNDTGEADHSSFDMNYPLPAIVSKDRFAWIRDEEFGRQMLAGQNPSTLECLKLFPPVSELDAKVYGPRRSAMTADHIIHQLDGLTVEQAVDQKKLFILDYHDLFMPFINDINSLEGRKAYATRTILYLTKDGILKPIAIELSLPPGPGGFPGSQRVFTPGDEHTGYWLWTLAKAHVCSNDSGHHQLVSHWLRSHAATEPYVIATHRHLSCMHPISRLIKPHFRYTMEINGSARQNLLAADGVIEQTVDASNADPVTKMMFKVIGTLSLESCFTPGKHCMEISSAVYKQMWRFDMEALPADLIRRGMAEEDPSSPHGLKLMIEDYPYAADGLLLWSEIESWVTDYVSIYYKDPSSVTNDIELQKWWAEIRLVGHADKKNEPWWPSLHTKEDLIRILTIITWITSGHHAAVNFGQFAYSGYIPNRPCLTRRLIPDEHEPEYQELVNNPQSFFLSMLPNQEQATVMMMIIEALSAHSPDEEYLGQRRPLWTSDTEALMAFKKFSSRMMTVEKEIEARNRNSRNKHRNGAGVAPYELLFPRSGPGITGRGVPNSVSI